MDKIKISDLFDKYEYDAPLLDQNFTDKVLNKTLYKRKSLLTRFNVYQRSIAGTVFVFVLLFLLFKNFNQIGQHQDSGLNLGPNNNIARDTSNHISFGESADTQTEQTDTVQKTDSGEVQNTQTEQDNIQNSQASQNADNSVQQTETDNSGETKSTQTQPETQVMKSVINEENTSSSTESGQEISYKDEPQSKKEPVEDTQTEQTLRAMDSMIAMDTQQDSGQTEESGDIGSLSQGADSLMSASSFGATSTSSSSQAVSDENAGTGDIQPKSGGGGQADVDNQIMDAMKASDTEALSGTIKQAQASTGSVKQEFTGHSQTVTSGANSTGTTQQPQPKPIEKEKIIANSTQPKKTSKPVPKKTSETKVVPKEEKKVEPTIQNTGDLQEDKASSKPKTYVASQFSSHTFGETSQKTSGLNIAGISKEKNIDYSLYIIPGIAILLGALGMYLVRTKKKK